MECYFESKVENFMLKVRGGDRFLMVKWLFIRVFYNLLVFIMDIFFCFKKGGK